MHTLLAEAAQIAADPYLLGAIAAEAGVIVYLYKRIEAFTKREQDRADRLATIIEKAAEMNGADGPGSDA